MDVDKAYYLLSLTFIAVQMSLLLACASSVCWYTSCSLMVSQSTSPASILSSVPTAKIVPCLVVVVVVVVLRSGGCQCQCQVVVRKVKC